MSSSLTPLPLGDVLEIADRRRRRRLKTRAAVASAAAVAGLGAAGVAAVSAFGPDRASSQVGPAGTPSVAVPSVADMTAGLPSEPPSPSVINDTAALDAFAAARYSFDDALVLAAAWGLDVQATKIEAGRYLAQGVDLADTPYAEPMPDYPYTEADLVRLFYANGYTLGDATVLAQEWGLTVTQAAAKGMSQLKVTRVLPFVDPPVTDDGSTELDAFFAAGCIVADAELLAELWGLPMDDLSEVKARAGRMLLAGDALPETTPALGCA